MRCLITCVQNCNFPSVLEIVRTLKHLFRKIALFVGYSQVLKNVKLMRMKIGLKSVLWFLGM